MKISIIGKSTVPAHCAEYQIVQKIAYHIAAQGHTIIHGGYAGGMMQAASDGASLAIQEFGFDPSHNLGVPELRFDTDYARVPTATFTEPTTDIYDRLRLVVGNSDMIIVAPIGGDGTMLEIQTVLHENMLARYTKKPVVPMIFLCSNTGTDWEQILFTQLILLTNDIQTIADIDWMHFVAMNEGVVIVERFLEDNRNN